MQTEDPAQTHLGEDGLDLVLESKVESLSGEVPDDIGEVAAPEGRKPLLLVHTDEAVGDACVSRDFTRLDARVRVLRLEDELHALDGSCGSLGDCAGHAT